MASINAKRYRYRMLVEITSEVFQATRLFEYAACSLVQAPTFTTLRKTPTQITKRMHVLSCHRSENVVNSSVLLQ